MRVDLPFKTWVLFSAILLGLFACSVEGPEIEVEPEPPRVALNPGDLSGYNIWLLSVDTLRADRIGAYGYETRKTTPNIDALLARGVLFSDASAPRALTWPSLASVLTGLFPSHHGLIHNGYELRDGQQTLNSVLSQNGYETAAFLSNMCQANHQDWDAFACAKGNDEQIRRDALGWANQRGSAVEGTERPFFLWTHFFGPHSPYYNGGDLAERLDPGYDGPVAAKKGVLNRIMSSRTPLNERDVDHLNALYDAAIIGTDDRIGKLVADLGEVLDLDRTLIVFLSDHGEDLYQHNQYLYHACSVYESSLHVPLAFVAPGALAPAATAQPVELVDIVPTILELTGNGVTEATEEFDGRSLLTSLNDPDLVQERPVISEYHYEETPLFTLKLGSEKLILNPDGITPNCIPTGPIDLYPIEPVELYDLELDPFEQTNLAQDHAERIRELTELLELRRQELGLTESNLTKQEVDAALREQLEELGYVVN